MMQKNGTRNWRPGVACLLCLILLCAWQCFFRHGATGLPVLARPFAWVDSWLEKDGRRGAVVDCLYEVIQRAKQNSN